LGKKLPFEPIPLQEQQGEISWAKFKEFIKQKRVNK
jgi:hypothetical protein